MFTRDGTSANVAEKLKISNKHCVVHLIDVFSGGNVFAAGSLHSFSLYISNSVSIPSFQIEATLISVNSITPSTLIKCLKMKDYLSYICFFAFTIKEAGEYQIGIRGNTCNIKNISESVSPLNSLGFLHGQKYEMKYMSSHTLKFKILDRSKMKNSCIQYSSPLSNLRTLRNVSCSFLSDFSQNIANSDALVQNDIKSHALKPCSFLDEVMLFQGKGFPRWRRKIWSVDIDDELKFRKIWYNDTFFWGNDLCYYKAYNIEDFMYAMD